KKLLAEIRALRKKLGRPLIQKDILEASKKKQVSSISRYYQVFGAVSHAINAAYAGRRWSRESMIKFLRSLDATLDRPIFGSDITKLYREGKGPSVKVLYTEFGGMVKARRAAGTKMTYHEERIGWSRGLTKYPKQALISQLQK